MKNLHLQKMKQHTGNYRFQLHSAATLHCRRYICSIAVCQGTCYPRLELGYFNCKLCEGGLLVLGTSLHGHLSQIDQKMLFQLEEDGVVPLVASLLHEDAEFGELGNIRR